MRTLAKTIVVAIGGFLLIAGTLPAQAQGGAPPAPALEFPFYVPPIVFDNALDEKILAAQAQMVVPHRLIRPHRHHHHH